jgi:hypothetical protein
MIGMILRQEKNMAYYYSMQVVYLDDTEKLNEWLKDHIGWEPFSVDIIRVNTGPFIIKLQLQVYLRKKVIVA